MIFKKRLWHLFRQESYFVTYVIFHNWTLIRNYCNVYFQSHHKLNGLLFRNVKRLHLYISILTNCIGSDYTHVERNNLIIVGVNACLIANSSYFDILFCSDFVAMPCRYKDPNDLLQCYDMFFYQYKFTK